MSRILALRDDVMSLEMQFVTASGSSLLSAENISLMVAAAGSGPPEAIRPRYDS